MDEKKYGPNGGDLDRLNPEWRKASLSVTTTEAGPTLHRFHDTATIGRKDEQPWHRMAAFMLLAGRTNSEIALAAGVVPATVSQLRAQKWFQELLAVLANEAGADVMGLLQGEAVASLEKMVKTRDFAESERLQYQAAKDLVELAHGKAVQRVISDTTHRMAKTPQQEMDDLMQDLKALER